MSWNFEVTMSQCPSLRQHHYPFCHFLGILLGHLHVLVNLIQLDSEDKSTPFLHYRNTICQHVLDTLLYSYNILRR